MRGNRSPPSSVEVAMAYDGGEIINDRKESVQTLVWIAQTTIRLDMTVIET